MAFVGVVRELLTMIDCGNVEEVKRLKRKENLDFNNIKLPTPSNVLQFAYDSKSEEMLEYVLSEVSPSNNVLGDLLDYACKSGRLGAIKKLANWISKDSPINDYIVRFAIRFAVEESKLNSIVTLAPYISYSMRNRILSEIKSNSLFWTSTAIETFLAATNYVDDGDKQSTMATDWYIENTAIYNLLYLDDGKSLINKLFFKGWKPAINYELLSTYRKVLPYAHNSELLRSDLKIEIVIRFFKSWELFCSTDIVEFASSNHLAKMKKMIDEFGWLFDLLNPADLSIQGGRQRLLILWEAGFSPELSAQDNFKEVEPIIKIASNELDASIKHLAFHLPPVICKLVKDYLLGINCSK